MTSEKRTERNSFLGGGIPTVPTSWTRFGWKQSKRGRGRNQKTTTCSKDAIDRDRVVGDGIVQMPEVAYRTVLGTEDAVHVPPGRASKLTLCETAVLGILTLGCYILSVFGMWAILEMTG